MTEQIAKHYGFRCYSLCISPFANNTLFCPVGVNLPDRAGNAAAVRVVRKEAAAWQLLLVASREPLAKIPCTYVLDTEKFVTAT